MQGTEPAFEAFDPNTTGIDSERLGFAQRQRVLAFLADSAYYLGLVGAGGERRQNDDRATAALPSAAEQLRAGARCC